MANSNSEGGDALIHLRVPAALKRRWVRESRAAGMRLTDWITQKIERAMTIICIPTDLTFNDLKLARESNGDVSFDAAVVGRIEQASGLPEGHFMGQHEDALSALIVQWYAAHRRHGGDPNAVADDLIAEAKIEDERGGGISHQPGRA